jgi:hypothetical protein
MVVSVLFFALFVLAIVAIVMCAAASDRELEYRLPEGPNLYEVQAWGALLDDVQRQKGAIIADAMKADREKAFADYLQTPGNAVPVIRKQTGDSA